MSWRFDRLDFLDINSHIGCRASGLDGRYLSFTEGPPLSVLLHSSPTLRAFYWPRDPLTVGLYL